MADKPKKTLYHSELVGMEAVQVEILSDVLDSKFKKGSQFVEMRIDGHTRSYNVENQDCADKLEGMKGRKVMLEATGSREEADIKILGSGDGDNEREERDTRREEPEREERHSERQEREPERKSAKPAPATGPALDLDNFKECKKDANRIANTWLAAFDAAIYVRNQVKSVHKDDALTSSEFNTLTTTIFIQLCRDGKNGMMPTGLYLDWVQKLEAARKK